MKPITVALDKVQSDSCKLSGAVEVWKALEEMMDSLQPFDFAQKVQLRSKQALTPAHYLANIINPKYLGRNLSHYELDIEICTLEYSSCLATMINFRAKSNPFKPFMFTEELVQTIQSCQKANNQLCQILEFSNYARQCWKFWQIMLKLCQKISQKNTQ